MKSRPHKLQPAALVLAILSIASTVFPFIRAGAEPSLRRDRTTVREEGASQPVKSAVDRAPRSLSLGFEANRGQAEADVKFVGRGPGFGLLLKPGEAVFALTKREPTFVSSPTADARPLIKRAPKSDRLVMKLEGANSTPFLCGLEPQEARANYFIGNDAAKWVRDVDTYSRVLYSSVYRGVDLTFYGNERQLEYDFTVAPGGDPNKIRLRFDGADDVRIDSGGQLILSTAAGELRNNRPIAYQESAGSRTEVAAQFKRLADGTIGFEVGDYDHARSLVIDPVVVYSTYLGGSASDFGRGIVADSAGTAYIVGDSVSSDFLHQASPTNSDVFVGRLAPSGLLLTYTFFGGTKNDSATGLAVDGSGSIYLCGTTESPDFPLLHSIGFALGGASDAFVVKLTPALDNSTLLFEYSSLIGGSGEETGVGIAIDNVGSAYITGRTSSTDFPTFSAIQASYGGGASDAFVSKLAADGASFVYSSFLGGSGTENSAGRTGISVDASGNAYVVGDTQSTNFPTKNPLQPAKSGSASTSDGFAAKINPSGSDFVYSTYLGGSNDDSALAVAADQNGNAYVTGRTKSASFPGSSATRTATGTTDAFVAKLNASGSAISYLTFIGGTGDDSADAIVVDSSGHAVIAGSAGDGLPTVESIQSFFKGGASDALVAQLGTTGAVTFSTYLGGGGDDVALGVSLDGAGAIYVTGFTDSTDFLTFAPLQPANAGARDIFITKIDPKATPNRPVLVQVFISGKNLILFGHNFDAGAVLRVNDQPTKTRNGDPDPSQVLIAKKAAKAIAPGQTVQLQIENPNGKLSNFLFLTKP
jgi:Beta-propeller repeat